MKIEYSPNKIGQVTETPHSIVERFKEEFIKLLRQHKLNKEVTFLITLKVKE